MKSEGPYLDELLERIRADRKAFSLRVRWLDQIPAESIWWPLAQWALYRPLQPLQMGWVFRTSTRQYVPPSADADARTIAHACWREASFFFQRVSGYSVLLLRHIVLRLLRLPYRFYRHRLDDPNRYDQALLHPEELFAGGSVIPAHQPTELRAAHVQGKQWIQAFFQRLHKGLSHS